MSRTIVEKTLAPGSYSHHGTTLVFYPGDPINGNKVKIIGGEYIAVRNTSASLTHTVTIQSSPDLFNRERDIIESILPGEQKLYGPFMLSGWKQADGYLYLDPSHTDIFIAIVSPPF